jgi:L-ascorbate metabolism protein UlaG (beta-lactamase superfamily)
VEHVFVSHPHGDHFDADAIADFAQKRAEAGLGPLRFYSGRAACNALRKTLDDRKLTRLVRIQRLRPGGQIQAGELTVKAVGARHDPNADPLCYICDWHGATVYYGTDTGYPPAETFEALAGEKFNAFLHEITFTVAGDGEVHMDLDDMRRLVGKLRREGAITPYTRVVGMHQCKLGPQIVPDYIHQQSMIGLEFGYDGMPIPVAYPDSSAKPKNE